MSKLLTKADIIAVDDLKSEIVSVPEWGGDVNIKALSLGQIDAIRERVETVVDGVAMFKGKFGYLMLADSMCGEDGLPLFQYNEIDALNKKSVAALKRCLDVCNRLNAMTPDAVAVAKNDSAATPSSDSPTA